ncbi:Protein YTP1 [Meyerozyma sp. JA9]|nr:Protein YTP1 [Meyerozyma sp. JA9]
MKGLYFTRAALPVVQYRLVKLQLGTIRMWSKKAGLLLAAFVVAASAADDGSEPEKADQHAFSKTIHFILTVILELFLPSVAAALAIADKLHWSLFFQYISTGYSVFDVVFLSFPDDSGHENRTSKGTGWFLTILFGIVVFVGTFINGSNLVINKFYPHWKSSSNSAGISQYGVSYKIYKITSFLVVPTGWVRVCVAPIALFGFCYDSHTGQCIAHGIMGSSFIMYGFVLSLVLIVPWIRCHPDPEAKSQDFYDSCLMWLWGLVNTFTEHRWGKEPWSHGDFLHTFLGLIWWAGASAALFITRSGGKRTLIPSLLLMFTAYAMKEHGQHQEISVKVHTFFGMALASAGLTRIVEISFILGDKRCSDNGKVLAFQHLPPFCLVLAGLMFMAANEEMLTLVEGLGMNHASYILLLTSAAFLIYLWMQALLALYLRLVGYNEDGELSQRGFGAVPEEEFELGDLSETEN